MQRLLCLTQIIELQIYTEILNNNLSLQKWKV